jgi:hypothetical protein
MQLRIWKRVYLSPFVRLNLYTRGLSISFGHRRIGPDYVQQARNSGDTGCAHTGCMPLSEGQQWLEMQPQHTKKNRLSHP